MTNIADIATTTVMSVTVVIPTYNRKHQVCNAIDSVLVQTLPVSQIIVVDDGSSDGTADFLTTRYNREIDVVRSEQNLGVSAARNLGIKMAKSQWIALLDSDDRWLPEKLHLQSKLFDRYRWIHGEENWWRNGHPLKQLAKHRKSAGNIFERSLKLCLVSPSAAVLHKSLFEDYGYFDEEFIVCEDYDLWLRIGMHEEIGFVSQPVVAKYGGHADQLSHKFRAMDYWRVRALQKCLSWEQLSPNRKSLVLQEMLYKTNLLIRGYLKHRNFTNWQEIFICRQQVIRQLGHGF